MSSGRDRISTPLVSIVCAFAVIFPFRHPAAAQPFFARGDATCSLTFSAADIVAEMQALDGVPVCDNADCDRDGMVSADDVTCAAYCVFGHCRVPPDAPEVMQIAPTTAPQIVPLSAVRLTGVNFGSPDRLKRVTIGGVAADVVRIVDADTLEVIVPLGLPPGPTDVVVFDGERPGVASTITIAAPTPLGTPDTLDGTLSLLDTAAVLLLEVDFDASVDPADAAALREQLQLLRSELAEQRGALAADPNYTPEVRTQLDAAIDASGTPEELRELIADIEALLAPAPQALVIAGAATGAIVVSRFASTAAILAAQAASAAARAAIPAAAAATGVPLAPILLIGTAIAVVGAYTLGRNSNEPLISSMKFRDRAGERTPFLVPGGTVEIRGSGFSPFPNVMIRTRSGDFTAERLSSTDTTLDARFPAEPGFCGAANVFIAKSLGVRSESTAVHVQPIIENPSSDMLNPGDDFQFDVLGLAPCDGALKFTGPGTSVEPLSGELPVMTTVPLVPPGHYNVTVEVDHTASDPATLEVKNAITGLTVTCTTAVLQVPPGMPSTTMCTANLQPAEAKAPFGSKFVWKSSSSSVSITNSSTATVTANGRKIGSAKIHASLVFGTMTLAESAQDADITVQDNTPPTISISSSSPATVMAGGSITVDLTASDNAGLGDLKVTATGDAVGNPSQDLLDCTLQKNCSTSFTVNLKQMGFMQNTIDISAEIVDAGLNRTTSNHLTFMINADTMCPVVTIQGPMGSVNAGDSRQASILVADNQMGDTGVKRVVVDISGEALVEAVHSDVTLPQAIPMATRLVPFAVKKAEDLANVMDKTITISAQAFDAAMPPNGCDPQMSTLTVLGVLDHCTGDITTSKAADCIGKPFTITVTLTGTAVANVDHVISTNPVGTFPLVPQGNGVYTVTLFFEGQGSFSLKFIALDKDNNELCSGSIGLTATGPCQGENGALQHGADDLAGATDHAH